MTDTAAQWSGATYERIAATFAPIHEELVNRLEPEPGQAFLDVACGTGAVALLAARAGAEVVGLDLSADQLEKARKAADDAGLTIHFDEGDCQALPYDDSRFDYVVSAFGFIFAPNHARAASELTRVCGAGGRLGFTAWPRGEWDRVAEELHRPVPEGDDARRWGDPAHAEDLLGAAFDLEFHSGAWVVPGTPEELWELARTSVPPLRSWLETLDAEHYAQAERVHLEFFGGGEMRREYLMVFGVRR